MYEISTNHIYTVQKDMLEMRAGKLVLDDSRDIISRFDTDGPHYVASGLTTDDYAVVLGYVPKVGGLETLDIHDPPEEEVLYLVTQVNSSDGSGIIVGRELVASDRKSWVNSRLVQLDRRLNQGKLIVEKFEPDFLEKYLKT